MGGGRGEGGGEEGGGGGRGGRGGGGGRNTGSAWIRYLPQTVRQHVRTLQPRQRACDITSNDPEEHRVHILTGEQLQRRFAASESNVKFTAVGERERSCSGVTVSDPAEVVTSRSSSHHGRPRL